MIGKVENFDPVFDLLRGELTSISRGLASDDEMAIGGRNDLPILEVTLPLPTLCKMLRKGLKGDHVITDTGDRDLAATARFFPILMFYFGKLSPRWQRTGEDWQESEDQELLHGSTSKGPSRVGGEI